VLCDSSKFVSSGFLHKKWGLALKYKQ